MNTEPRSRLVGRRAMVVGFQNVFGKNRLAEEAFCSHFLQYTGFEVGPRELALLLIQALEKGSKREVDISKVIDAVVGDKGKPVGDATKKYWEMWLA